MVITDLDRTLLRNDKTISDYTVSVLQACQARGITVAFATARSERASERFTSRITPDIMISNGGALVRQGERVLYKSMMSQEVVNALIQYCRNCSGVGYITADCEDGYFVNYAIDINHPDWKDYAYAIHTDFSLGFSCGVYKITIEIDDDQVAREIAEAFPQIDMLTFSGEGWRRFADHGATKWNAISAMTEILGVDASEIVAFGDDFSDVEMLKKCGIGVAVGNAIDEAKAVADVLCGTNDEDGVAKWIAHNVL